MHVKRAVATRALAWRLFVVQELQRTVVRDCLWWRGCTFRKCPESREALQMMQASVNDGRRCDMKTSQPYAPRC